MERRELTGAECFVLQEVQAYWGDQNTIDEVFFTDAGEAALLVRARDGSTQVMVVLTTSVNGITMGRSRSRR